ncbi:hypothetical protein WR25_16013 [Diploscapter pachys]|uniref:Uncharacterized protein n=1 Tax=Diploscapter pachys TaxID=2018661 RepID=A0A2A2M3U8_9BILA|nr:hypothetical protein WR25_16013 [Diploscapter pachys]
MQEDFRTVGRAQGQRVTGAGQLHHLAGTRGVQHVVEWVDGDAVTEGGAAEHRVRHLLQRHQRPGERGMEDDLVIVTLLRWRGWSGSRPRASARAAAMT